MSFFKYIFLVPLSLFSVNIFADELEFYISNFPGVYNDPTLACRSLNGLTLQNIVVETASYIPGRVDYENRQGICLINPVDGTYNNTMYPVVVRYKIKGSCVADGASVYAGRVNILGQWGSDDWLSLTDAATAKFSGTTVCYQNCTYAFDYLSNESGSESIFQGKYARTTEVCTSQDNRELAPKHTYASYDGDFLQSSSDNTGEILSAVSSMISGVQAAINASTQSISGQLSGLSEYISGIASGISGNISALSEALNGQMSGVHSHLNAQDSAINAQMSGVHGHLDAQDSALSALNTKVDGLTTGSEGNDIDLTGVESRLDTTNKKIDDLSSFLSGDGDIDTSSLNADVTFRDLDQRSLSTNTFSYSAQCPIDRTLSLANFSYTFSFSTWCSYLSIIGNFIMIAAYLYAAYIIVSKS